jgi:hypothetical protein
VRNFLFNEKGCGNGSLELLAKIDDVLESQRGDRRIRRSDSRQKLKGRHEAMNADKKNLGILYFGAGLALLLIFVTPPTAAISASDGVTFLIAQNASGTDEGMIEKGRHHQPGSSGGGTNPGNLGSSPSQPSGEVSGRKVAPSSSTGSRGVGSTIFIKDKNGKIRTIQLGGSGHSGHGGKPTGSQGVGSTIFIKDKNGKIRTIQLGDPSHSGDSSSKGHKGMR